MKIMLHNKGELAGIYKIVNLTNNRVYVGSTTRLRKRAHEHKKHLETNVHSNVFLQGDFNKCGAGAFLLELIEVVENNHNKLLEREQHFIDQYYDGQKLCYNLCSIAGSRKNSKNARPFNPETDGRAIPKTQDWIDNVTTKNKEFWNTEDNKQIAFDNAMKRWKEHSANVVLVHMETKEEVLVETSLRQFALERNLSYKSLHQLIKRKTKSCGGWYLKDIGEPVYKSQKGEKRKPLSEEHREKISTSLNQFHQNNF